MIAGSGLARRVLAESARFSCWCDVCSWAGAMRFASLAAFVVLVVACGGEDGSRVPNPPATDTPASDSPATESASDAASEAAPDDCTPKGYECHPYPSCRGEYMPLANFSCGATGGYCCIKGKMPPSQ